MEYILMDLEFNQAYNFEDGNKTVLVPECPFEIIQVGMAKMDENFNIKDTLNLYAKPQLYKRMHPVVKKITGIMDEDIKDKRTFPEIYPEISAFMGNEDNIICIWGASDVKFLYRNIMYYKLAHDNLPKNYINLQQLTSQYLKLTGSMTIGLKNAVEALNIETDIDFHDALNDAIYTGKIFKIVAKSHKDMNVLTYSMENKSIEENKNYTFSTPHLYKEAEKLFGRKLSKKEKEIVKKIYAMGRSKKYDFNTNCKLKIY